MSSESQGIQSLLRCNSFLRMGATFCVCSDLPVKDITSHRARNRLEADIIPEGQFSDPDSDEDDVDDSDTDSSGKSDESCGDSSDSDTGDLCEPTGGEGV